MSEEQIRELAEEFVGKYHGLLNTDITNVQKVTANLLFQHFRPAAPTGREAPDEECICKGNWREIVKETEPLFGQHFTDGEKEFTLEGLLHTEDDYYYALRSCADGTFRLLSCVGSIEGHGYKQVGRAALKTSKESDKEI